MIFMDTIRFYFNAVSLSNTGGALNWIWVLIKLFQVYLGAYLRGALKRSRALIRIVSVIHF